MVRRKIEKPCPIRKELKRVQRMEQEKVSLIELDDLNKGILWEYKLVQLQQVL